jgi:hypothetical protein
MKVKGYEVPGLVERACLRRMHNLREGRFRALDISALARELGSKIDARDIGMEIGDRIADRLIQRERQAKRIRKADRYPYWVAA